VKNEVKKIFVHNVNEDANKCSAMHVRSMLLKTMIIAVQKMHLNEIYFSRDKISQFESKNLRSQDIETLTHWDHNIIEKQLNSVAETIDCKQLVSHAIVKVLTIHETIYDSSSKFIVELIKILQQENKFAVKIKADRMMNMRKNDVKAWILNSQEIIEYNRALYVSENISVKEELLKHHHDDFLTRHFDADKISELLDCKYYWKDIIKDVKKYVNICDICQRIKMKHH
jgi:hypothetical protein